MASMACSCGLLDRLHVSALFPGSGSCCPAPRTSGYAKAALIPRQPLQVTRSQITTLGAGAWLSKGGSVRVCSSDSRHDQLETSETTMEDRRAIDKSEEIMEDPYGPVEEAMNYSVVTVGEDEPLENILEHLEHFTGMPVVDKDGICVGVVSDKDVSKFVDDHECHTEEEAIRLLQEPVRKLMSKPAITIKERAPIAFAAGLMLQHKVHRLPVTDREGRVVGIITRRDIYKPLLQQVNPLYGKHSINDWHNLGD